MINSGAQEGAKEELRNAFHLMMRRDKSAFRTRGFRTLRHGSNYYPFILCELRDDLLLQDLPPDMDYEEFYERYFHRVIGLASEELFEKFWEKRAWDCPEARLPYTWPYLPNAYQPCGPGASIDIEDMEYQWYKPQDLKGFVIQRGLRDPFPEGVTLSYYYIRVLERADKLYRFRLLDLPVEMRLNVYRELLLFSKTIDMDEFDEGEDDKFCYPAILQTCREINKEAKSVLYDENTISVNFEFNDDDDEGAIRVAKIHNTTITGGCAHSQFVRIPGGIDDYPDFLARISHLEINVKSDVYGMFDNYRELVRHHPLNYYLYTLASFLMDNHRLRTLDMNVDLEGIEERGYGFTLWPLRRLRNLKSVNITGLPSKYKTSIVKDLTSAEPVFNTMKHWKHLQDQAIKQLELLAEVYGECCDCRDCLAPPQMSAIDHWLEEIESAKQESCLSSCDEERVIALLANLRNTLNDMSPNRIEELAQSLKQQRVAYTKYKAVTDDGRLAEAAKIWNGKLNDERKKDADDEDWADDEENNTDEATSMDEAPAPPPTKPFFRPRYS